MTFLLALLAGCTLQNLTDGGRYYTAIDLLPVGQECGVRPDGQTAYCLVGTCVEPEARTCSGPRCDMGPLYTYPAGDTLDVCPEHGGSCLQGDFCDPRQRGCIATTASCQGEPEMPDPPADTAAP